MTHPARGPQADGVRGVAYVVAKAPLPGEAKTRLCPPLTPEHAAELASAFLLDTLDTVRAAGLVPRLICRTAAERTLLQAVVGPATQMDVQHGTGLGDALETAFRCGLADGFGAVAVLGADSPTLPVTVLREGFDAILNDGAVEVALGVSDDGGYYVLAARALHPTLFHDMEWSTSRVAAETLARCRDAALRTHLLPTWYDVDDSASLDRLQRELTALPFEVAPRTRAALRQRVLAGS